MTLPTPPRPDLPSSGQPETFPGATWRPIEAVPLFIVALFAAAVLTVPISLIESCSAQYDLAVLAGEVALAAAVLWWVAFIRKTPLRALGAPRRPWGDLVTGLLVGLALVVVAAIVLAMVQAIATKVIGHAPKEPDQVVACVHGAGLVFLAPIVIVAAPLGEELFFRGFLYQGLRRRFSIWPAALLSGCLFGLVHLGGVAFLLIVPSLAAVGVGLALVFERRKSLVASMAAHAAFNIVGYITIALRR
jgi:membrane protease YdiL (CAAX protease family)